MSTISEDELTVFSDYVCPFCYLGKAAMEEYLEEAEDPPEVEWHVFDLRGYKRHPDGSIDHDVEDGKDDDYFAQVRDNVERLKDEYDVEMTLDYSLEVDSWDAQKVSLYVKQAYDEETFEEFHERTFKALWRDGRDIGDPDVIADIAESVGVPEEEVRDAIDDDGLEAELKRRFEEAQEMGVSGIPTFAYDGHAARGAIPPHQFERLVEGT
ncbi:MULTISPECIES: DsbA family oxidoreductase [Halorussus]|uniref:DsbA family oxidoreductase n=1 Tax=Halorussus TaxID=1070314 RepID=UPI0020A01C00|nr:DsbA family protein [Halorussus vallis]USZ74852.1 DsbA family protein [Halorussus vallis]